MDMKTTRLTVQIPETLETQLEQKKKELGCSKAALLRLCASQYLEEL